jgi:hypothetical protein
VEQKAQKIQAVVKLTAISPASPAETLDRQGTQSEAFPYDSGRTIPEWATQGCK